MPAFSSAVTTARHRLYFMIVSSEAFTDSLRKSWKLLVKVSRALAPKLFTAFVINLYDSMSWFLQSMQMRSVAA